MEDRPACGLCPATDGWLTNITAGAILWTAIEGVLSRSEMKNIKAGATNCVLCISESHGAEFWEVEFDGQDPSDVCNNDIWYPEGQTVTGIWGTC